VPRMKVLLSAYACEPHRGSEPGLGWHTAVHLADRHDVWVLTAGYHRAAIERELAVHPVPGLTVVYVDVLERYRSHIPDEGTRINIHYYLWQLVAARVARRLHRRLRFDVAHHVSYARCWSPSYIAL